METVKDFIKTYVLPKTWRGAINWVIFAVLIVALVKTCVKEREFDRLISEAGSVGPVPKTPATDKAEELYRRINTEGKETVIFKISEPIIKKIVDQAKNDSLARLLSIERNRIKSYTEINGALEKENIILRASKRETVDTDAARWSYSDPWLNIDADKNDTSIIIHKLWADASVSQVDHDNKKYWFFGRNEKLSTVWFNSPYVRVNGLNRLTIKEKEPLFNLDVRLGARYLHDQQQLLMGPSVRLGIGRVGVSGGYYLNPVGRVGNSVWYGIDWKMF